MEDTNGQRGENSEKKAKAIRDLDELVKAILTSLPATKPWQRQLRQYLLDIDKQLQILRMTISMGRTAEEVAASASELRKVLRVAQRYVAVGRADLGTKAAIEFGCELGQRIATALAAQGV